MKIYYNVCRYPAIFTRPEKITDAQQVINRRCDMPEFTDMDGVKEISERQI